MKFFLGGLFLLLFVTVQAQDEEAISDQDLTNYAVMMDSIDRMRSSLLNEIQDLVKNSSELSVSRYNELSKIADDSVKLAELNATPGELSALKEIISRRDLGTKNINETFKSMAKETIGASTYNKIKKKLKSDSDFQTKYETILQKVSQSGSNEEDDNYGAG